MPDSTEAQDALSGPLIVLRIITIALIAGVCLFLGFLWIQGELAKPPNGQTISLMSAAAAGVMLVAQFTVPLFIQSSDESRDPAEVESRALALFATRHIIRMALLEGAAMLNVVAVLTEHNQWSLAIIGVLLFAMLLQWPSRLRLQQFVENRRFDASFRAPE